MVPKGLERLASKGLCHDLRHAHGQSRGATGSVEDSVFAHVGCGLIDRFGGDRPTPIANYLGCLLRRVADYRRRGHAVIVLDHNACRNPYRPR